MAVREFGITKRELTWKEIRSEQISGVKRVWSYKEVILYEENLKPGS